MKAIRQILFHFLVFIGFITLVFGYIYAQCNCLGYYKKNDPSAYIQHYHGNRNCVGYAFAQARNNMGGPDGNPEDVHMNEEWVMRLWKNYNLFSVKNYKNLGFIAIWETENGESVLHAAVLTYLDQEFNDWRANHVDGGVFHEGDLLGDIRDDDPDYYLKQVPSYYGITGTVKNDFYGGEVIVDEWNRDSGFIFNWIKDSEHEIEAIDEQDYDNYIRIYKKWEEDGAVVATAPDMDVDITATENKVSHTFEAKFDSKSRITFENDFSGTSQAGKMKVNGVMKDPISNYTFYVEEDYSINAEAVDQTIGGIIYTFDKWNDNEGSTPNNRYNTFTPNGHCTYTASFNGKPTQVQNTGFDCGFGDPIKLIWDEHSNNNVNYRIYRKKRDQYGHVSGPARIATVQHGTTSYTDNDYVMSRTYQYLLKYDVRAYYTTEGTEADENWNLAIFGEIEFDKEKKGDAESFVLLPNRFDISNYPNPFNPITQISYTIPEPTPVNLAIYNLNGQLIKTLYRGYRNAGIYLQTWNATDESGAALPAGLYLLTMESPNKVYRHKLILLK